MKSKEDLQQAKPFSHVRLVSLHAGRSIRALAALVISLALIVGTSTAAQADEEYWNWDNYDPVITTPIDLPIPDAVMPEQAPIKAWWCTAKKENGKWVATTTKRQVGMGGDATHVIHGSSWNRPDKFISREMLLARTENDETKNLPWVFVPHSGAKESASVPPEFTAEYREIYESSKPEFGAFGFGCQESTVNLNPEYHPLKVCRMAEGKGDLYKRTPTAIVNGYPSFKGEVNLGIISPFWSMGWDGMKLSGDAYRKAVVNFMGRSQSLVLNSNGSLSEGDPAKAFSRIFQGCTVLETKAYWDKVCTQMFNDRINTERAWAERFRRVNLKEYSDSHPYRATFNQAYLLNGPKQFYREPESPNDGRPEWKPAGTWNPGKWVGTANAYGEREWQLGQGYKKTSNDTISAHNEPCSTAANPPGEGKWKWANDIYPNHAGGCTACSGLWDELYRKAIGGGQESPNTKPSAKPKSKTSVVAKAAPRVKRGKIASRHLRVQVRSSKSLRKASVGYVIQVSRAKGRLMWRKYSSERMTINGKVATQTTKKLRNAKNLRYRVCVQSNKLVKASCSRTIRVR